MPVTVTRTTTGSILALDEDGFGIEVVADPDYRDDDPYSIGHYRINIVNNGSEYVHMTRNLLVEFARAILNHVDSLG